MGCPLAHSVEQATLDLKVMSLSLALSIEAYLKNTSLKNIELQNMSL